MGERFTDVVGDWVRLSACESCGGREFRKEFARLFICRKGERVGSLCVCVSEKVVRCFFRF